MWMSVMLHHKKSVMNVFAAWQLWAAFAVEGNSSKGVLSSLSYPVSVRWASLRLLLHTQYECESAGTCYGAAEGKW